MSNTLEAVLILKDQNFSAGISQAREATAGLVEPTKVAAAGTRALGQAGKDAAGGVDQLGDEAQETAAQTAKLGQAAKESAGGGVKQLMDGLKAVAGLAIVQKVANTTLELGRLGIQSKATSDKFTALAGSAANAEQYLLKIRTGTDYTIDKMTAMQSVSKLLSMGLTDNAESAAEFVVMATRLGDASVSTGDRINDFAALLANQSIPRLDNYSISSGRVRQRIEELQAAHAGLSREAAFTQAVLEEGRLSLERLGEAGTGSVQAIERLEAASANLRLEVGERVAPALAFLAENAAALLTHHDRLSDAFTQNAETALAAGRSWEEYATQQYRVRLEIGWYSQVAAMVNEQLVAEGASVEEVNAVLGDNNRLVEYAVAHGMGFKETLDRTSYAARQTTAVYEQMGVASRNYVNDLLREQSARSRSVGITDQHRAAVARLNAEQARSADARLADAQGIAANNQALAQLPGLYAQLATLEGQLATTTGWRTAATEKARDAQLGERDAILEKIKAIEQEAEKQLAQEAVETLKQEDFKSAEEYTRAKQELMLATGLVTKEALAEQTAIGLLTTAYADGKIDAGDYALVLDDVREASSDGKVSLEELLTPLRRDREEMARAEPKARDLAKGIDGVGSSAGGAQGKVGTFADKLGTTDEKLRALVKGSPYKLTVVTTQSGGGGTSGGGDDTPGSGEQQQRAATSATRGVGLASSAIASLGATRAMTYAAAAPRSGAPVSVTFAPTVVVGNRVDENKLLWRMRTELGRVVKHYARA